MKVTSTRCVTGSPISTMRCGRCGTTSTGNRTASITVCESIRAAFDATDGISQFSDNMATLQTDMTAMIGGMDEMVGGMAEMNAVFPQMVAQFPR